MKLDITLRSIKACIMFTLCVATESTATITNGCPKGTANSDDLKQGELLLNQSDIRKPNLSDQIKFGSYKKYEPFKAAPNHTITKYNLKSDKKWYWIVAPVIGLFGNNAKEALYNFNSYVIINASYFRSTKKIVIYAVTPETGVRVSSKFSILLRVPKETMYVKQECATFR